MKVFPEEQAEALADLNRRIDEALNALPSELAPLAAAVVCAHCAFVGGFWHGRTSVPSDHDAEQVAQANSEILNSVNAIVSARLGLSVEQTDTVTAMLSPLLAEMGDILDAAIGPPSNYRGLIIAQEVK